MNVQMQRGANGKQAGQAGAPNFASLAASTLLGKNAPKISLADLALPAPASNEAEDMMPSPHETAEKLKSLSTKINKDVMRQLLEKKLKVPTQ